tara:strand:+ start:269 stop:481 length:213 start_codon:yes stop_codon:yes gene_type:complete
MGIIPNILGVDEQGLAYDITRAHSADIWFLKMRYRIWGITAAIFMLLIGNIMGSLGFNFFSETFDLFKEW